MSRTTTISNYTTDTCPVRNFRSALEALTDARENAEQSGHPYVSREEHDDMISESQDKLHNALQEVAIALLSDGDGSPVLQIRLEVGEDTFEV